MSNGKNGTLLGKAIAIAASVHRDQTDMGGHAYVLHPIRLMMRLRTDDEELMCIAILHDCVEDSGGVVTIQSLKDDGFPARVTDALTLLTHDKTTPYEEYIRQIATNPDAIAIKIEDLDDNSRITRLKGLRPKDFARVEKYHRAYMYLTSVRKANKDAGYGR